MPDSPSRPALSPAAHQERGGQRTHLLARGFVARTASDDLPHARAARAADQVIAAPRTPEECIKNQYFGIVIALVLIPLVVLGQVLTAPLPMRRGTRR